MKRTIVLILIFLALQFACGLPLVVATMVEAVKNPAAAADSKVLMEIPGMVNLLCICTLVSNLLMIFFLLKCRFYVHKNHTKPTALVLWLTVPLTIAMAYALDILLSVFDLPNLLEDQFESMSVNPFGIIAICLAAPICEEMLFRGAIEGHLLRTGHKPWIAIAVSALIFGIIHGNPAQMPSAFLLGLLLGWLYYRTGSLWPSIVCHVANNTLSTVISIVYPDKQSFTEVFTNTAVQWTLTAAALLLGAGIVWLIACRVPRPAPVTEPESTNVFPPKEIAYIDDYDHNTIP
jgi:membrane protease YdiL (CAAX protease family)